MKKGCHMVRGPLPPGVKLDENVCNNAIISFEGRKSP